MFHAISGETYLVESELYSVLCKGQTFALVSCFSEKPT